MERDTSVRMLFALTVSIALHLSFIYGVGIGPSKAAPAQTILARLAPQAVISASTVAAKPASATPARKPILAAPAALGSQFARALAVPPVLPDSVRPSVSFPEMRLDEPPEPAPAIPARLEESSLPRADVPLIVDAEWYTAKDLDLYPRALAPVEPAYPPSAADVSGDVLLQLMIDEFGAVSEATVVKAEPAGYFEESALQAFKAARFSPAQRDGYAVRSRVVVKVRFAPQTQASAGR
jgi:protein TonB